MAERKIGILRELLSHPGETLKEVLESNNMTQKELAVRINVTEKHITGIITGKNTISSEVALNLSKVFSLSANFWNTLQANYDAELKKIEEYEQITDEEREIVRKSKYNDLVRYGYIENATNIDDKVVNMRSFWGVSKLSKIAELFAPGTSPIAAFRKSINCVTNPYAMASWLKICEIETDDVVVDEYDLGKLKDELNTIKELMLVNDPNYIVQELGKIFQKCGIAFAVVRNLQGAPVQGLIKKIDNKIRLCITLRGAHADIFWFTLFHEIGHLFNMSKDDWKIDYQNNADCQDINKSELDADNFANKCLISENEYNIFVKTGDFSEQKIIEFSEHQKILPCVLIGRLKHDKIIPYNYYNKFNVNYIWVN